MINLLPEPKRLLETGGDVGGGRATFRRGFAQVIRQCRLQTAEAEVQRAGEKRARESHRAGIAFFADPVDDRPAGIPETE